MGLARHIWLDPTSPAKMRHVGFCCLVWARRSGRSGIAAPFEEVQLRLCFAFYNSVPYAHRPNDQGYVNLSGDKKDDDYKACAVFAYFGLWLQLQSTPQKDAEAYPVEG